MCKIGISIGLTYVGALHYVFMSQCATRWICQVGAEVMLYLHLEIIILGPCNICFVSTVPLISGVHDRSQTEIGAPTLSLMLIRKGINLDEWIWMKCTSLYCSQLGRVAHLGMSIGHPQKFLLALHQHHLPLYGL